MRLREILGVLSKSSPYAVSAEKSDAVLSDLDKIKKYLYIETEIEKDFRNLITQLSEKKIIFLCGSSGDGKSEIMTRYSQNPQFSFIDFHLDATHSFDPKLDAVATLDKTFTNYKTTNRPLVVGINLGMMANYAKEGSSEHDEIKEAMQCHIQKNGEFEGISFLSFEDPKYSKFRFEDSKATSEFASKFMRKLTQPSTNGFVNPIWDSMLAEESSGLDAVTVANFRLLSMESVQSTIIELLMRARLAKDQFLTARALLDFIYTLLVGKTYLFDNLFLSKNNELSEKISSFDPALLRTERLDNIALTLKLNLPEAGFLAFKDHLKEIGVGLLDSSASYIRLFYVLRNAKFGNDYHLAYSAEFDNKLLTQYSSVLAAHKNYKSENDETEKSVINDFYKHILFTALWRYINRSAPKLKSKQFLISKENGVLFATELRLLVDWQAIVEYESDDLMSFNALIKINKKTLKPALPVNINLFELLQRLNLGYRPNKYDKSCVLLLDELVEQIKIEMSKSDTLVIIDEDNAYEAERDGNLIEITER
jgi:DNA phosphorothioation-dependent restriction protein DptF